MLGSRVISTYSDSCLGVLTPPALARPSTSRGSSNQRVVSNPHPVKPSGRCHPVPPVDVPLEAAQLRRHLAEGSEPGELLNPLPLWRFFCWGWVWFELLESCRCSVTTSVEQLFAAVHSLWEGA